MLRLGFGVMLLVWSGGVWYCACQWIWPCHQARVSWDPRGCSRNNPWWTFGRHSPSPWHSSSAFRPGLITAPWLVRYSLLAEIPYFSSTYLVRSLKVPFSSIINLRRVSLWCCNSIFVEWKDYLYEERLMDIHLGKRNDRSFFFFFQLTWKRVDWTAVRYLRWFEKSSAHARNANGRQMNCTETEPLYMMAPGECRVRLNCAAHPSVHTDACDRPIRKSCGLHPCLDLEYKQCMQLAYTRNSYPHIPGRSTMHRDWFMPEIQVPDACMYLRSTQ